ncbi:MAG: FeoB-associated Cys-rich membrane protein [Clostridia bacterium]|nr:FeoB-associated Cys-rich membrane protein [Clostridia bacterium]
MVAALVVAGVIGLTLWRKKKGKTGCGCGCDGCSGCGNRSACPTAQTADQDEKQD